MGWADYQTLDRVRLDCTIWVESDRGQPFFIWVGISLSKLSLIGPSFNSVTHASLISLIN